MINIVITLKDIIGFILIFLAIISLLIWLAYKITYTILNWIEERRNKND